MIKQIFLISLITCNMNTLTFFATHDSAKDEASFDDFCQQQEALLISMLDTEHKQTINDEELSTSQRSQNPVETEQSAKHHKDPQLHTQKQEERSEYEREFKDIENYVHAKLKKGYYFNFVTQGYPFATVSRLWRNLSQEQKEQEEEKYRVLCPESAESLYQTTPQEASLEQEKRLAVMKKYQTILSEAKQYASEQNEKQREEMQKATKARHKCHLQAIQNRAKNSVYNAQLSRLLLLIENNQTFNQATQRLSKKDKQHYSRMLNQESQGLNKEERKQFYKHIFPEQRKNKEQISFIADLLS